MLGGSSSHSEMIYFRGHPQDWNGLAKNVNDESYNYTNIVKHYKNVEHFVGTLLKKDLGINCFHYYFIIKVESPEGITNKSLFYS